MGGGEGVGQSNGWELLQGSGSQIEVFPPLLNLSVCMSAGDEPLRFSVPHARWIYFRLIFPRHIAGFHLRTRRYSRVYQTYFDAACSMTVVSLSGWLSCMPHRMLQALTNMKPRHFVHQKHQRGWPAVDFHPAVRGPEADRRALCRRSGGRCFGARL